MGQRRWMGRAFTLALAAWLVSFHGLPEVIPAEVKTEESSSVVQLKTGKISGVVTSADGKTGLSNVSLRVIDPKTGKVAAQTTSDQKGAYAVGPLSAGKYQLVVGGWMVTDVELTSEAQLTQLNLVLPRAAYRLLAADIMSDAEAGAVPLVERDMARTVALTAAVATIVAVPIVLVITRRERKKYVSPIIP